MAKFHEDTTHEKVDGTVKTITNWFYKCNVPWFKIALESHEVPVNVWEDSCTGAASSIGVGFYIDGKHVPRLGGD